METGNELICLNCNKSFMALSLEESYCQECDRDNDDRFPNYNLYDEENNVDETIWTCPNCGETMEIISENKFICNYCS